TTDMKKIVMTFILCLCSIFTMQAKERHIRLVMVFKDETTAEFNLTDRPKVKFHQDKTYVTYQTYTFEFKTQDINTFEFIAADNTEYANRMCVLDVNQTEGVILLKQATDGHDSSTSLSSLDKGEFEFKIGNSYSFKLIKK
ncbi:MAG: hypothetical protein KBT06_10740, partial [Prevotellaceae bacterium]|nr:hypothetical protein [Candidatus Colivivens equi]